MGIGMVVHRGAVSFAPAQNQQIELSIASIHEIPRVGVTIELGIFAPLPRIGLVAEHKVIHHLDVNIVGLEFPVKGGDQVRQGIHLRSVFQGFLQRLIVASGLTQVLLLVNLLDLGVDLGQGHFGLALIDLGCEKGSGS